jgi:hypothetical protein
MPSGPAAPTLLGVVEPLELCDMVTHLVGRRGRDVEPLSVLLDVGVEAREVDRVPRCADSRSSRAREASG